MLRKRLRKSSTGSGSGSTERTSEELPNEVTLTSPGGSNLGTLIKPEIGTYTSEPNTPIRIKQHSSDSERDLQRDSSQESGEGDATHQITLVNGFLFNKLDVILKNFCLVRFSVVLMCQFFL